MITLSKEGSCGAFLSFGKESSGNLPSEFFTLGKKFPSEKVSLVRGAGQKFPSKIVSLGDDGRLFLCFALRSWYDSRSKTKARDGMKQ